MAVLWKYDVVVMDAAHSKSREDHIWELGRSGWEVITILPGDYKTGDRDAAKLTFFLKREATHDINF
jgi:hypothetical protein